MSDSQDRPVISGFRGILIYIALGVGITFFAKAVAGGDVAAVVGVTFLLSSMIAFPWIARRS